MGRRLIAVDPGDVHCGVAVFKDDGDGWYYSSGIELPPDDFEEALARDIVAGDVDILAYERFRLYADKSREQKGSEFRTSQCIGAMEFMTRSHNAHVTLHQRADAREPGAPPLLTCELPGAPCNDPSRVVLRPVAVYREFADIKKPIAGILRTMRFKSGAKIHKLGPHCYDAELHGWYCILHTLKEDYVK